LSSTTDPRRERGQVLVIFALVLVTLMIFAALAFDTGMMLVERRDQQNAADAAALAGARFLPGSTADAEAAARSVATANGFTEGLNSVSVDVSFPSTGKIEVLIDADRSSIFGGIIGQPTWDIGSKAVAVNQDGVPAPFAMLSLEEVDCDAIQVTGNGSVTANGNIQVNSECPDGALHRGGSGSITVTAEGAACNVVGDIKDPGDKIECEKNEGAQSIPDPLEGLAPPDPQGVPDAPVQEAGGTKDIPDACPGGASPATAAAPAACQFTSAYAGTTWRLFPGDYPGGLKLQGGTFYLEAGIYYIAGGGLEITGNGSATTSVDGGTVLDFGVLIYNTEDTDYTDECAAGTATAPTDMCIQPIVLNGSDASIRLYPLDSGTPWDGIVIFSDRNLDAPGDDLQVNGSSDGTSDMEIRGTIYLPAGQIKINGNEGNVTVDQIIADKFLVNGSEGSNIQILFDTDFIFGITAQGLIE
jgi:Flp pilus assembly protein TadG